MRRFWAHITLVITALVLAGTTFFGIFTKMQTNLEYTEGSEITYRITDKDDVHGEGEFEDDTVVKSIASDMEDRLDKANVTAYNIYTYGNDIIKVQFSEPNENQKSNIVNYLRFNGSLALSNIDDDENYLHITGDEFLLKGKEAYLDSVNNYPTIVIPIDKNSASFKDLVERTQKQQEEGKGETTETDETDEEGNKKTITTTYLYLWYDFNEDTDRYSRTQSGNADYDVNIARKIIMKFNIAELYYPDDEENKLAASINMDTDGDQKISQTEVRNAYDNARFYVNLLNSSKLDYQVTQINDQKVQFVPATTESLIKNSDPHQYVAWSRTFIATLAAIAIVGLLLAVFFKLSTLSIFTSSIVSIYASIAFMVLMNAEFNIAALIAIIAVAVASLASGILYACRLKEESYKGRTLKKANSEAAKKALLPTLDIHIALMFIGAFVYLFGGSLMRSFALISVVGGLSSLVINLLILRGLMWLITNNTSFNGKYSLFGIEQDKVPSLTDEIKQEPYKGPYENKDLTKHRKPIGIASLVLLAASIAGLITFGILGNNQPFAQVSPSPISEVYVYSTNELNTLDSLKNDVLSKVIIYKNANDEEGKTLDTYIKEENYYSHTETVEGVEEVTYYFVYTLNEKLNNNTVATPGYVTGAGKGTLETALADYNGVDSKTRLSVKVGTEYTVSKANFGGIIAGTSIAVAIIGLYLLIRYRLSRGLVALVTPYVTTAIGVGLFALTRLAFPSTTAVIIPFIAFFTIIISIFFMNKEREMIIEDKTRVITLDHREELMKKATSVAFDSILILAIVVCYIGINFFGFGPSATSLIFIVLTIATIIASIIVVNQFGPCAHFLYSKFHRLEDGERTKKPRKNKKIQSATHRSSEPEEAVFIGIND